MDTDVTITSRELAKELVVPHRKAIQAVNRWVKSSSNYNNRYTDNRIYQYLRISTYTGKKDKIYDQYILNTAAANIIKRCVKI